MAKALLIVDVQNDFCPGGSLAVKDGDQVVEPLNEMVALARHADGWLVLASRDWHPAVTKHFKLYGGIWPVHCVQNTKGAEFHPQLNVKKAAIISKGMGQDENAYSAFDGFLTEMPLKKLLENNDVSEIYIGGLATDYCVKASVLDAVKHDFRTYLLLDACKAVNLQPDDEKKAIEEMLRAGVVITSTEEVIIENIG